MSAMIIKCVSGLWIGSGFDVRGRKFCDLGNFSASSGSNSMRSVIIIAIEVTSDASSLRSRMSSLNSSANVSNGLNAIKVVTDWSATRAATAPARATRTAE